MVAITEGKGRTQIRLLCCPGTLWKSTFISRLAPIKRFQKVVGASDWPLKMCLAAEFKITLLQQQLPPQCWFNFPVNAWSWTSPLHLDFLWACVCSASNGTHFVVSSLSSGSHFVAASTTQSCPRLKKGGPLYLICDLKAKPLPLLKEHIWNRGII